MDFVSVALGCLRPQQFLGGGNFFVVPALEGLGKLVAVKYLNLFFVIYLLFL
jgi:hypothetical protein